MVNRLLGWGFGLWSALHAYNASSQVVSSVKATFIENPNTRKVVRVSMANLFRLNNMEIQGFPSAKLPAPLLSTGPAV